MNGDPQFYLRLIRDEAHDGHWNMAVDESILRNQIQTKGQNPILRFYRFNDSTITTGYGIWKSVAQGQNHQAPFIRRMTGGGMVLHRPEDLTYSFIVPLERYKILRRVKDSYFLIHDALRKALQYFDIATELFERNHPAGQSAYCFESPVADDVMFCGQKIAGAAQKRTLGYLLHQGSIAWGILTQASQRLSEPVFCRQFSIVLGTLLGVGPEEIPWNAEELEEMTAFALK
ncbi:MAG: lipoate--protein ligase family protein [Candidatus Omnitrophica bacterium]|nr:lipoate--protein ligase family protein [Candidatus Omnitrophota bacterium]